MEHDSFRKFLASQKFKEYKESGGSSATLKTNGSDKGKVDFFEKIDFSLFLPSLHHLNYCCSLYLLVSLVHLSPLPPSSLPLSSLPPSLSPPFLPPSLLPSSLSPSPILYLKCCHHADLSRPIRSYLIRFFLFLPFSHVLGRLSLPFHLLTIQKRTGILSWLGKKRHTNRPASSGSITKSPSVVLLQDYVKRQSQQGGGGAGEGREKERVSSVIEEPEDDE